MKERRDRASGKISEDIVNQFSILLRTSQIHDIGNEAVTTAIDKFLSPVNAVIEIEHRAVIEVLGEFIYTNGTRIRHSVDNLLNYNFLIRELKKREIGSVVFMDVVLSEDVRLFLKAFVASIFSDEPRKEMWGLMEESPRILLGKKKTRTEDGQNDTRRAIKSTYYHAVSYAKGAMAKLRRGEKVNMAKAKRIMQTMVDQILTEESLLVSMTAIKNYDEYTYHHSVNVSILAIALGQRLGMSRKTLTELGIAALFHDIGKIEIPYEILNKPTGFSDDEWKVMRRHPRWGVRAIMKLRDLQVNTIRSTIVAFEHHLNCDLSGYPKVGTYGQLDLHSRIVSLADRYDAMTSARIYSRNPMPPDKALSVMMEETPKKLDPLLFKFFVNMVGVFPVGTLVMLSSRELGLVYESEAFYADRPAVLIVVNETGQRVKGPVVNLTDKDENGRYRRTIVKTLDPNKYRINLAEYLL